MTGIAATFGTLIDRPQSLAPGFYRYEYYGNSNLDPTWFLDQTPYASGVVGATSGRIGFNDTYFNASYSFEWLGYWYSNSNGVTEFYIDGANTGAQIWIGREAITRYTDFPPKEKSLGDVRKFFGFPMIGGVYYPMRIQWATYPRLLYYTSSGYPVYDYNGNMQLGWKYNSTSYTEVYPGRVFYNPETNGF